jgi:hypothetical protein
MMGLNKGEMVALKEKTPSHIPILQFGGTEKKIKEPELWEYQRESTVTINFSHGKYAPTFWYRPRYLFSVLSECAIVGAPETLEPTGIKSTATLDDLKKYDKDYFIELAQKQKQEYLQNIQSKDEIVTNFEKFIEKESLDGPK